MSEVGCLRHSPPAPHPHTHPPTRLRTLMLFFEAAGLLGLHGRCGWDQHTTTVPQRQEHNHSASISATTVPAPASARPSHQCLDLALPPVHSTRRPCRTVTITPREYPRIHSGGVKRPPYSNDTCHGQDRQRYSTGPDGKGLRWRARVTRSAARRAYLYCSLNRVSRRSPSTSVRALL